MVRIDEGTTNLTYNTNRVGPIVRGWKIRLLFVRFVLFVVLTKLCNKIALPFWSMSPSISYLSWSNLKV